MLTIKGKIILSSSIIFSLTLITLGIWLYRSTRQSEYAKIDARLEGLAEEIHSEIEEELNDNQFPDSLDLLSVKIEGLPRTFMQIFDAAGNKILSNPTISSSAQAQWKPEYRTRSFFYDLKIGANAYRNIWSPVEVEEDYPYVLQLAAPLSEVNASLGHLKIILMISLPLAIILSALAIYLTTSLAFLPLVSMANTAQRISATSLDQRLNVPPTNDEVQKLSLTLNRMFERLEFAFINQRQFVADASHEIRTPLMILNTELEYARKMTSEAEVIKSIDSCLEEIDRLSRMTGSLLLLAKLDSESLIARKQVFRLDEIIVEIVHNMTMLADHKSIMLNIYIENAIELYSDIDLAKHAFINVLENAIKYTPNGGKVTISLRSPIPSGDAAEICFEDNGPGISSGDLKKIFNRFFRGEDARKESDGSGLGLSIAQMLIGHLGGHIKIDSELGRGTKVTIKFPIIT